MLVRYRAGSLDQAMATFRRRSILMSCSVLLVLALGILMLVVLTERARSLAEMQAEFVLGVSHELRTPLTVIRLAADNLKKGMVEGPEKAQNYGEIIGTHAAETTLLTALAKFIPPEERILLIEDIAEIQLRHENLVRFEARREQNGTPAVSIRDLLKAALRHRPDRILLGEIRSGEAFDLLQLLNTGHSGTLSTIHASSAKQALARFTSCVLQSGVELPYRSVKTNIGDSLNVVAQIERRPGRRFVSEVLEINSYDPDADLFDFAAVYLAPPEHP